MHRPRRLDLRRRHRRDGVGESIYNCPVGGTKKVLGEPAETVNFRKTSYLLTQAVKARAGHLETPVSLSHPTTDEISALTVHTRKPGMNLTQAAHDLAAQLNAARQRIVFAESCTGGLVAATLTTVPGISQWFCGSAVTYREATKSDWLSILPSLIERHTAVSQIVTEQMAEATLRMTPEATVATAVTGHLGPDAPQELDGVVFISTVVRRDPQSLSTRRAMLGSTTRVDRQQESAGLVLESATEVLKSLT